MSRKRHAASGGPQPFRASAHGQNEEIRGRPSAVRGTGLQPNDPDAADLDALVLHHWFDSGTKGEPYSATLHLRGRRRGITGRPTARDVFEKEEAYDGIVPGTGPVSLTSWIYGLNGGDWDVDAKLIRPVRVTSQSPLAERRERRAAEPVDRATWSWRRWALGSDRAGPVSTRWAPAAPLARMPGVQPGIWALFGALGIIAAVVVQALIVRRDGIDPIRAVAVDLVVIAASLVAAKLWYRALHPGPWRTWIQGWSVDGFLFVGSIVGFVTLAVSGVPIGPFLDASAPGLFLGIAIGRVGCFLTGCCAGRCTRSRWGVWSSDRRIGARRLPTQLIESGIGLSLGLASGVLVIGAFMPRTGLIFTFAFGAYVVARQALLRLRAESRTFSWRRAAAREDPAR